MTDHTVPGPSGIGERLRIVRREAGFTQAELGERSGTNQAVIQKIENGNSLRPRQIMDISEVVKCNPAWLQFGSKFAAKALPSPLPGMSR